MASVQLYKIQFLKNNMFGTFVTGDVLDIYLDTDLATGVSSNYLGETAGITIKLNGIDLPYTATFIDIGPTSISVQAFNPSVCIGTSLLKWDGVRMFYPYGSYVPLENNNSCIFNPPTCDLFVVGVPDVVPATSQTDADGVINVVASSINPIQYKLGSDFSYNDGTAQATGSFTALLPGSYRVYLRDSANCFANVLVVVPINNTYGLRFRLEYTDLNGEQTRIDITRRGYSGSVSEVCGADTPFIVSLRGEGSIDKFISLLGISVNLNLVSESDLQFIELYTNDPNLYRIEYYKSSDLKLITKVLPQQYSEQFKAPPYYVSVTATDGLAELSQQYLVQNDGQKYFGTIKLIKLIAHCLNSTKIRLPIRVACNLYAMGMLTGESNDPLDQAYCDFERFYIEESQPALDMILRSILDPFGARLTQWEGRWNIVRAEEMVGSYDYRDFDDNGDYLSNGNYNPVVDIDYPTNNGDLLLVEGDHNLEVKPGYGMLRANYKLGLKPNILRNGDFRLTPVYNASTNSYSFALNKDGWTLVNSGHAIEEAYEELTDGNIGYVLTSRGGAINGNAYIQSDTYQIAMGNNNQLKISIRCKVMDPSFSVWDIFPIPGGTTIELKVNVPYTKIRLRVQGGSYYLRSDGQWTPVVNDVIFYLKNFNTFQDFELLANQHPLGYSSFKVSVFQAYVFHGQFQNVTELKAFPTKDIKGDYKTEVRIYQTSPFTALYMRYYTLQDNTDSPDNNLIVRPDDYHATTNPRQWVKTTGYPEEVFETSTSGGVTNSGKHIFVIDRVVVRFLTDGSEPLNAVVRQVKGESQNNSVLEKDLLLGSFSNLIVVESNFNGGSLTLVQAKVILSADLIYTSHLRDAAGLGYENWKRDGVAEEDKLHGILLKSYATQYKKSWRLLRGSIYANEYFGFLNVARNVNDNNSIFLPMGLELNDKRCIYNGELAELIPAIGGSDGGGSSPYNSAFSTGFGSSGFN